MVMGIEPTLTAWAQAGSSAGTFGECIPLWLAGTVVGPLAGAVAYQTRRVLDLTRRIDALTDRYLAHTERDHDQGA